MTLSSQLGLIYLVSEVILRFSRRSASIARRSDSGSLLALWVAIGVGVSVGIVTAERVHSAGFQLGPMGRNLAVTAFVVGLALRWWAIVSLGRFFTVDVAIAMDHRLVIRGPYRFMRHPSYSGMMLAFVGLAVTLFNFVSIAAVLVPISLALAYRIRVEERALNDAFGPEYALYSRTTKRLIPGLF